MSCRSSPRSHVTIYVETKRREKASYDTLILLLIWSYGVALGPWMYMAHQDLQSDPGAHSHMVTFFAEVAYIVMVLVAIFGGATLLELTMVFGGIMLVAMLIQTGIAFAELREENRFGKTDALSESEVTTQDGLVENLEGGKSSKERIFHSEIESWWGRRNRLSDTNPFDFDDF